MKAKKFLGSLLAVLSLTVFFVTVSVPVVSNSNQALASTNCQGGWINVCPSFGDHDVTNHKPKETDTQPQETMSNKNDLKDSPLIVPLIISILVGVTGTLFYGISLIKNLINK